MVITADDFIKQLVYFYFLEHTFASWALYSLEVFFFYFFILF